MKKRVGMKGLVKHRSRVEGLILFLRDERVLLDADLATIYGVSTKALNQAVKRNGERFPIDFRFQLSDVEKQEVVTKCDHLARLKYSKARPHAFTEHGALMVANVRGDCSRKGRQGRKAPTRVGAQTRGVRGFSACLRSFPFGKELGRPGLLRSADDTSKAKGRSSVPGLSG